jgi:hypothetical protein
MDDRQLAADPHGRARSDILASEARLAATYERDLARELSLVDDATSLLLLVLTEVGRLRGEIPLDKAGVPERDAELTRLAALQLMGVRGLRVIRAARATLSAGYEAEARALDRILIELQANRGAVVADETGKTAVDWLKGKLASGITKRVAAIAPDTLYKDLSSDAHGGPTPVIRLIGTATAEVGIAPERTRKSRASLLMYAGFARDHAALIADHAGFRLGGLHDLDDAIAAATRDLSAAAS